MNETDLHKLFVVYLNPSVFVSVVSTPATDPISKNALERYEGVGELTTGKLLSRSLPLHRPSQSGRK